LETRLHIATPNIQLGIASFGGGYGEDLMGRWAVGEMNAGRCVHDECLEDERK
jgi:hypothetical protein